MSRIGNKPIQLPKGVSIAQKENTVEVSGPKGKLETPVFPGISIEQQEESLVVKRANDTKDLASKHGLVRSLLANNVVGVSDGFSKLLILNGVGYKAAKKGKQLVLSLGYSHEIDYNEPEGVNIEVVEPTKVKVSGIDKQKVGQVAAEIRSFRKPEPYKGKGVRYENEVIRRKAGKTGKK